MLTAILPIFHTENPFWLSSKGHECIRDFMSSCKDINGIDRIIVITSAPAIQSLAEKLGLESQPLKWQTALDQQYTFEDSWNIAVKFKALCPKPDDGLLIIDHRNLLTTTTFIRHAIALFKKSPDTDVISLAPCHDYPCQYQSFAIFSDCAIIDFNTAHEKNGITHIHQNVTSSVSRQGNTLQVSIDVHGNREAGYHLTFHRRKKDKNKYVAQILPFTERGPVFDESLEVFIPDLVHEICLDAKNTGNWSGIICIFSRPAQSGEYDMVEVFSPPKAPWELKGSGSALFRKKDNKPMNGRQQFPAAYTYDGSLCILSRLGLSKDSTALNPTPAVMTPSRIVTDWVDYYYTTAIRRQSLGREVHQDS